MVLRNTINLHSLDPVIRNTDYSSIDLTGHYDTIPKPRIQRAYDASITGFLQDAFKSVCGSCNPDAKGSTPTPDPSKPADNANPSPSTPPAPKTGDPNAIDPPAPGQKTGYWVNQVNQICWVGK